jgi:hypothetical protein
VYPENLAQRELILSFAMRAGFAGGVVVDFPHRYAMNLLGQSYNRVFLHVKIVSVHNISGGLLEGTSLRIFIFNSLLYVSLHLNILKLIKKFSIICLFILVIKFSLMMRCTQTDHMGPTNSDKSIHAFESSEFTSTYTLYVRVRNSSFYLK